MRERLSTFIYNASSVSSQKRSFFLGGFALEKRGQKDFPRLLLRGAQWIMSMGKVGHDMEISKTYMFFNSKR